MHEEGNIYQWWRQPRCLPLESKLPERADQAAQSREGGHWWRSRRCRRSAPGTQLPGSKRIAAM